MNLIMVAVEVWGNTYMNFTMRDAKGENRNQTNVAVLAFERYYGTYKYVRLLGDPIKNDTFVGFAEYESNMYILAKKEDPPGNIWLRTFNIYLGILRTDSG